MKGVLNFTTENQVVRYVQTQARYYNGGYEMPDGRAGSNYAVQVENKIYLADEPRQLVLDICDDFDIDAL
jgi:hypothetical protein